MKISAIVDEKEVRIAITPETAKKYAALGFEVTLPKNYGAAVGFSDDEYKSAGAKIVANTSVPVADIYLCVSPTLSSKTYAKIKSGSHFIALLSPFKNEKILKKMIADGVNLYALEKIPRITRAQAMDVLSSQANIAGYKAMLDAMSLYGRVIPMMMTAAGTIRPAKVIILGAGVAGLQAIATAKRLGAVVCAYDVRAAAKEQVESLGASFVSIENDENAETSGGYAKEMSDDYKKRQEAKLAEVIKGMDIVITTAQIPGKPAPLLVTKKMVESMAPGSIIMDMSTETGGNCAISKKDKIVEHNGVKIVGYTDFPARVAQDSSKLFARNVLNFVECMVKDGKIDLSDEIVKATKIVE